MLLKQQHRTLPVKGLPPQHGNDYANGEYQRLINVCQNLVRKDFNNLSAHLGIAQCHTQLGEHAKAMHILDKIARIAAQKYNRSLKYEDLDILSRIEAYRAKNSIRRGDFANGWRDLWTATRILHPPGPPWWEGQTMDGKRLLITEKSGFGDLFQFIRYLPQVKELSRAHIVLAVPDAVKPAIMNCTGYDELYGVDEYLAGVEHGSAQDKFDAQTRLYHLPGIFGAEADAIPNVLYVRASQESVDRWKAELRQLAPHRLCIGLIWAGSPNNPENVLRSMPPEALAALAGVPGVTYFGLQVGPGRVGAPRVPAALKMVDLGDQIQNFGDTAGILAGLDLLITVETGPAHLAGAMHRPCWTLLSQNTCWRWMLDREDSPWYPSMKLYRQTHLGDWGGVMERVARDLGAWAAEKHDLRDQEGCR